MSTIGGSVLIVAPFWRHAPHVGIHRVERFVRWLHESGVRIVLVRAGGTENVTATEWGTEITVRDPIGLYRDPDGPRAPVWRRGRSRLRRLATLALFSPDATIPWARQVIDHPLVLAHGSGAEWVVASSPPESVHVAAAALARRLKAKLLVDLRDGWLDEPNKPFLRLLPLRRWHEGRLEARSLGQADRVLVTSEGWRRQLVRRRPEVGPKVHVLTNGYPAHDLPRGGERPAATSGVLELLYTGQFTYSRSTQRPRLMLEPLWLAGRPGGRQGNIELVGNLSPEDLAEVDAWRARLADVGWRVGVHGPVQRNEALGRMRRADGLLLLSASDAAIPSKTFEYLPSGRPILTVTNKGGALWELGEQVPQMFLSDPRDPRGSLTRVQAFLDACANPHHDYVPPQQFTDSALARQFREFLGLPRSPR
jgi:glycosyltransferase involved in cell wall biosynthesis